MVEETEEARKRRMRFKRQEAGLKVAGPKPEDDLESIKQALAEEVDEGEAELLRTFRKDVDLREVFIGVVLNPVSRYGELKLQEKFKGQRMSAYRKLDKLRDLKLIKFMNVMDIRDKKIGKEKLTKEEREVLRKFKDWSRSMTEKQEKMYLSKTNYYAPTEKGMDRELLRFIANVRKEKPVL